MHVEMFPCLDDNYGFLLHDETTGTTAAIDTPDATVIKKTLEANQWQLTHILNTHHHGDHVGGNLSLKQWSGCEIIAPEKDAHRIPGIDRGVRDGETFSLGNLIVRVYETPGHTLGHIVYLLPDEKIAFVGDTLFSMGCGRLFEGSASQMWASLSKILSWDENTLIYCAHEYTEANGHFAQTLEPNNGDLLARITAVRRLRAAGHATVPMTLALEKATNPFLRPGSEQLRTSVGLPDGNEAEVFGRTRALKDAFRG